MSSFKAIASFMNSRDTTDSLRGLWEAHRHLSNEAVSFRNLCQRHNHPTSKVANFLCYNTWLLRSPVGDKPVIPYRAYLIGKELAKSKYDLAALTEVFENDDAQVIKKKSGIRHEAAGHQGAFISSDLEFFDSGGGLYTLSQFPIIGRPNLLKYEFDGGSGVSDAWAQKGVLHLELDVGPGHIDLYSTHLIFGTTFPFDNPIPELERDLLRIAQVSELRNFITATHKPQNIAVVTGDFNIDADPNSTDFNAYGAMTRLLSSFDLDNGKTSGFDDLWLSKGGRNGGTDNAFTKCRNRYQDGSVFCEDNGSNLRGRIDYIFMERPTRFHNFMLDSTTLRRRPFPIPHLDLNEVIDMLDAVGITDDLKDSIEAKFDLDVDNLLQFSPTRRDVVLTISRHGDLQQLVNNFLIGQISTFIAESKDESQRSPTTMAEAKQLSDHIGLDTVFLASPI